MNGIEKRNYVKNYVIILILATAGFFVRYVGFREIDLSLNLKIYFLSIFFFGFIWEVLFFINRKFNQVLPFERSIPGRIVAQLAVGVAFMVLFRLFLFYFGEPYLPFKFDDLFRISTFLIFILLGVDKNQFLLVKEPDLVRFYRNQGVAMQGKKPLLIFLLHTPPWTHHSF